MKYITYGIHTRLYYLVKHVGGIDIEVRREGLRVKYGFDDETLDIILMYDVEKLIKNNTIEEIKEMIIKKNSSKKLESERAMRDLTRLLTRLCCTSNMLRAGNYF